MPSAEKAAVEALLTSVTAFAEDNGEQLLLELPGYSLLLRRWIGYLEQKHRTGVADELLRGAHAALMECAGCLSLGLVRPALFSIRAQVDMLLAWLYFKDHLVEWRKVESTGDGYMMKSHVIDYLQAHDKKVQGRLKLLGENASHGIGDAYRFLSAHVHSQNTSTAPSYAALSDLVYSAGDAKACLKVQAAASEYMSDVCSLAFAGEYDAFPEEVKSNLKGRLLPGHLAAMFGYK